MNLTKASEKLYTWLMHPVHASTLCTFRLVYSGIMMAQIMKWANIFDEFQKSIYTLPYPGFGWVKPVDPFTGKALLLLCFITSAMLCIGFRCRVCSFINFLTFTYLFLICESNHNNHYILMCHINFVGCFLDWGKWASLDHFIKLQKAKRALEKNKEDKKYLFEPLVVPRWHLLLMQLLFCIPYFFGSIAKLNSDWLFRAQPLKLWFSKKRARYYHYWILPWFVAWAGVIYDFIISFLLYWKPTRYIIAFPAALTFNISNKFLFNIGVFPMAMISSLVLFLEPHFPAEIWFILTSPRPPPPPPPSKDSKISEEKSHNKKKHHKFGFKNDKIKWHKLYVLIFFSGFVIFHALFPLRHFVLYKSNPSWTEEGHLGAWHMKLRTKRGDMILSVEEENGNITKLAPKYDPFINRRQYSKVSYRPHAFIKYVEKLEQVFKEAKRPLKSIYVESCYALNANPERMLYIPNANILNYSGKYENIGVTGIENFLYTYEDAPKCTLDSFYHHLHSERKWIRKNYRQLYEDAKLFKDTVVVKNRQYSAIKHYDGQRLQFGYTWHYYAS